jgi:hypothetical protein
LDACNLEFAREMVAAFGEDRFYHAVLRPSVISRPEGKREARAIFLALGGSEQKWAEKCRELKLRNGYGMASNEMEAEEARKALCRTAFMLARHRKEYALKTPEMPPSIHARMILDSGNEWTEKYVKVLEDFKS